MTKDPSVRSMAAAVAANTRWAQAGTEDRRQASERLMAGQDRRYARVALDPEEQLTPEQLDAAIASTPPRELAARIAAARKAHMLRASLAAARARDVQRVQHPKPQVT